MNHSQFAATANIPRTCSAQDINFGGACFNCGYDPRKWTIKPGNIASLCHVVTAEGVERDCIFMSDEKGVLVFINGALGSEPRELAAFRALPPAVRGAVNKHFAAVFALSVDKRGAFLKTCKPFQVEAHTC